MNAALSAGRPFDPRMLDDAALTSLTDTLFPVHEAIFAGAGRDTFRSYVLESEAERTRLQLYHAPDGQVVGYAAVHVFERVLAGRNTALMRAEVGLLPAWRGRSAAGGLLAQEALRLLVTRPRWTRCFASCPVHPASYYALARNHAAVWPRPNAEPPPAIRTLLDTLDEVLELERPSDAGPLVRDVGWITREGPNEADYWSTHEDPLVRFYVTQNPTYAAGHGLLTLVPLDIRSVLSGLAGMARRFLQRLRAARRPRPGGKLATRRPAEFSRDCCGDRRSPGPRPARPAPPIRS